MRQSEWLNSTPLRVALMYTALSLLTFLVAGAVAYQFMKWELQREQDRSISQMFSVIASSYEGGRSDFLDTLNAYVRATPGHARLFRVTSRQGREFAGNFTPVSTLQPGWSTLVGRDLGLEPDGYYRLYTGRVHGVDLTVGASGQQIDDLESLAINGYAWAFVFVALVTFGGGGVLASRLQRRLDAIHSTMDRVASGDLYARVPITGRNDDIDSLAVKLNKALERLATNVEGVRQVSVDIAHDLKTPLGRLKIRLMKAKDLQQKGLPLGDIIDLAVEQVDQINAIFEALLRITRIESGARKARFDSVDLNEICATLLDIYEDVATDSEMVLTYKKPDIRKARIRGDRDLLIQMLSNLIENSIRHCPAGARIEIGLSEVSGDFLLSVQDNGPGIPEQERERVLRRFYRLELSRTMPGSGLGLSLVKAIADLHEARVKLEDSHPGLRVSVTFPYKLSQTSASTAK